MRIKYLIEKEFKQMFRNSFLPRLIIGFPLMMMLVLPWAANMEIRNINLTVVDNCKNTYSRRLLEKASSSDYFHLVEVASSYEEAMDGVERGNTDVILEIPATFDRDFVKEGNSKVLISVNTVNGTKGSLGSTYLSSIVADFNKEIISESGISGKEIIPQVEIIVQNRFNPHMDYKIFMVPALVVMALTMLCGFLPALNIVSEKEKGTIEQINVTPVSKFTFIVAKLIPYWIVGFIVLSLCFLLAWIVYGLTPQGSLLTVYLYALLYVFAMSGFGLVISNYSDTMQQAMFVMYFFMMILMLMSGLFTPLSGMPQWAQNMAMFNPLKYFIQVMRQVYLKGSSITELAPQAIALVSFALFFNGWAILSYRKRG